MTLNIHHENGTTLIPVWFDAKTLRLGFGWRLGTMA